MLEWLPEYDLGIAEIDHQHRGIWHLVNALAATIEQQDYAAAAGTIDCLLQSSHRHFDFEEDLMRREAYPELDLHHEQHSELLASMARMRDDLVEHRYSVDRSRSMRFLCDWFSIHVVRTDAEFAKFLKTRQLV